ncbi:hypothetical protein [Enterocloster citroniae]
MYDIDLIVEEASPIGIVKYLNIPYKESGKTIFIECPVHERETGSRDRHINNCVLGKTFRKAFYCHSCHGSGNGFELIAGYLHLDIKKDFVQILKIAAESCGGEELFIISNSEYSQRKKKKEALEEFGIFVDELSELGLESNLFTQIYIASYDESQLSDTYGLKRDTNFDVYTPNQLNKVSYLDVQTQGRLFSSLPRDIYFDIIKSKAKEKMELYKKMVTDRNLFENPLISSVNPEQRESLAEELKNEFRLRYISIENIYCKVASEDEISELNDNWLYDI